jgi:hypothetical protein
MKSPGIIAYYEYNKFLLLKRYCHPCASRGLPMHSGPGLQYKGCQSLLNQLSFLIEGCLPLRAGGLISAKAGIIHKYFTILTTKHENRPSV